MKFEKCGGVQQIQLKFDHINEAKKQPSSHIWF
jgi:hypothetical protein